MTNKIKHYFVHLFIIVFVILLGCQVETFYYVENRSMKDVKGLFINREINDTLERFILEQDTRYLFYSSKYSIVWSHEGDTIHYGYDLVITQDSVLTTKDYTIYKNWESGKNNSSIFIVREEDF